MKRILTGFLIFLFLISLVLVFSKASAGEIAPRPAFLSVGNLADWLLTSGNLGSGTGPLPAIASEGMRYTDLTEPSAPVEYRWTQGDWIQMGVASGSSNATKLRGIDIATNTPAPGQILFYTGSKWIPAYLASRTTTIISISTSTVFFPGFEISDSGKIILFGNGLLQEPGIHYNVVSSDEVQLTSNAASGTRFHAVKLY